MKNIMALLTDFGYRHRDRTRKYWHHNWQYKCRRHRFKHRYHKL